MESMDKGVAGDGNIGGGGSGVKVGGGNLAGLILGVCLDSPSPLDPSDTLPSLSLLAFRLPLTELFFGLPAPLVPLTVRISLRKISIYLVFTIESSFSFLSNPTRSLCLL